MKEEDAGGRGWHIREMVIGDYRRVISLWKNTPGIGLSDADSKEKLGEFLRRNRGFSYVAEAACANGDEIIGTVICGHDGRRGYIYHLAVHTDYRLKGVGNELVEHCLAALEKEKIGKCHLFVFKDNVPGIKFWEKTGWSKREDLYIYSKKITGE